MNLRNILIGVGLALLVALVFHRVGEFGYIDYDDDEYVSRNPYVRAGVTRVGVVWALESWDAANWHPITWLSHQLDVELFGDHPGRHHLTSALIHLVNTLLVFSLLTRMTGSAWPSALAAALFAVHPLRAESVAWISERKDTLGLFFGLLSLRSWLGWVERRSRGDWAKSLFWFGLSLASKPTLITLPFVLLLLDAWPLRRRPGQERGLDARTLIAEKSGMFLLSALSALMTWKVQLEGRAVSGLESTPWSERLGNAAVAYVAYLRDFFWPTDLSFIHPRPATPWPWTDVGIAVGVLVVVSLVTAALFRRCPYLLVGWLWYLGAMVPMIGLIPVGLHWRADRYTYFPMLGIAVAVSFAWVEWTSTGWARRLWLGPIGAVAAVALLAYACFFEANAWSDTVTLTTLALQRDGSNHIALGVQGYALEKQGQHALALDRYREAIKLQPDQPEIRTQYGVALTRQLRFAEAERELAQALETKPDLAAAAHALGVARVEQGQLKEGLESIRGAIARQPRNTAFRLDAALLLLRAGNVDEAKKEVDEAVNLSPLSARAHAVLARVLLRMGQSEEARVEAERSIELDPQSADAHWALAQTQIEDGEYREGARSLERAASLSPDDPSLRFELAIALTLANRPADAVEQYRKCLDLRPSWLEAANNLAWLYATSDDPAARSAAKAVEIAEEINRKTELKEAEYLDTLAAAYAENKQFGRAINFIEQAIAIAQRKGREEAVREMKHRWDDYRAARPYRQPPTPPKEKKKDASPPSAQNPK